MFQLLISLVELYKNLEQKVVRLDGENKILKIENAELRERLGLTAIKLRKKDRFYGIMMYTNKFKGSMSKKGSNKIYSK